MLVGSLVLACRVLRARASILPAPSHEQATASTTHSSTCTQRLTAFAAWSGAEACWCTITCVSERSVWTVLRKLCVLLAALLLAVCGDVCLLLVVRVLLWLVLVSPLWVVSCAAVSRTGAAVPAAAGSLVHWAAIRLPRSSSVSSCSSPVCSACCAACPAAAVSAAACAAPSCFACSTAAACSAAAAASAFAFLLAASSACCFLCSARFTSLSSSMRFLSSESLCNSCSACSISPSTFWKRCLMFSRTPAALAAYCALRSNAVLYSLIFCLSSSRLAEFFSMQVFLHPLSSSVPSQQSQMPSSTKEVARSLGSCPRFLQ
eukprot:GHRR01024014.1.p1 GENE.GHRR01024014.1~~GHRR01024014.1.p1  ORF type:complete len:319 (-),score=54.07 GHRR01024014.1:496-1452(-)